MEGVIQMGRKPKSRNSAEVMALKRLAIQIAAQLPDDEGDALEVLDYAKSLVRSFLGEPAPV